jgi:hypothetical protein
MQIKNFGTPFAIGTLLTCVAFGLANADELITTTTTNVGAPSAVAVAPISGGVVYFHTASPEVLVTTIESRRKMLDEIINQARQRGDISVEQSDAMKRELKRIALETGANTISYPLAVMLAEDLDLIGAKYATVVTTAPVYVPIIKGSHFTVVGGAIYQLDDLSMRRADLDGRVIKDYLEGRLSASRADDLRAQLSNIGTEAAIYQADGNVDFKESRRLYNEFDHVASEMEKSAGKDNK